uniref:Transposase n=1 Tax=Panagrolaimus davidi TaxID=227884 RepID=A0A914Q8U6_9BILA
MSTKTPEVFPGKASKALTLHDKFYCLNLNIGKTQHPAIANTVHFKSNSFFKKNFDTELDNVHNHKCWNDKNYSWNKKDSQITLPPFQIDVSNLYDSTEKAKSRSMMSLQIIAFENQDEQITVAKPLPKKTSIKPWQRLVGSAVSEIFEFCRQQQDSQNVPEIMDFSSSQRLLTAELDEDEMNVLSQGFNTFSILHSDDEEEETRPRNKACNEACCNQSETAHENTVSEDAMFEVCENNSLVSTIEHHNLYLTRLKESDKRINPLPPLQLISTPCKCGLRCDTLLSIIHRFIQLALQGVDHPVHPNTGKRFERDSTVEKLARIAMYIEENFDSDPARNSFLPPSHATKCSTVGEALQIPHNKRRNLNFTRLLKKMACKTHFVAGNDLTKCTICTSYSFKVRKTSLSAQEKAKLLLEWETHKIRISKKVEDNDRMFCGLNLAIVHQKDGPHNTTTVGFFSPASCYDTTTNSIISQLLFTISSLPFVPPTIFIQVDNFPGNKSYLFFGVFEYLLLRQKAIKEFYISFMQPGHTHCNVDARFGNFSTFLNSRECGSPQELISAFKECIPGQAIMKQTIYDFKSVLTQYCNHYGTLKSMYDFHLYLDGNNVPMVENARFHLSETLLCGQRQNEETFTTKIFKEKKNFHH